MPILITLDIFSGMPNPAWELTEEQASQLKEKLNALKEKSFYKTPSIYYGLGYRGFIVETIGEEHLPPKMLINANLVDFGWERETFIDHSHEIEKWLLSSSQDRLDKELLSFVLEAIVDKKNEIDFFLNKSNFNAELFAEPPYDPGWWNNDATRLRSNNCYNYACNVATNTFAQPGKGSGRQYGALNCGEVASAANRDGLITSALGGTPAQGHFNALVIWPGRDFHWYRRDNTGLWSHKPGQTPVRNVDNVGAIIRDPRNCNRGGYTDFCSFFICIPGRIRII